MSQYLDFKPEFLTLKSLLQANLISHSLIFHYKHDSLLIQKLLEVNYTESFEADSDIDYFMKNERKIMRRNSFLLDSYTDRCSHHTILQ